METLSQWYNGRVRTRIKRLLKMVPKFFSWLNRPFQSHRWLFLGVASVLVIIAGLIRLWAAPISAGPDVGQFWGFAKLFEIHGLDFYRYADGTDKILPVNGWGYVYPPIWLLITRLSLVFSPHSLATSSLVDISWRVAMKVPIIAADLAIGGLLMWAIPGARLKRLALGALWLFHPTAWYNSAVFGQFDAIAAALLLVSVIMFMKGRDRYGFVFAALAALTKQHAALPALLMAATVAHQLGWRRVAVDLAIALGIVVAISIPFAIGSNLIPYARSVVFPAQGPSYQSPLVYAFSGSGSILTYLHDTLGWNTEHFLMYNTPLLIAATLAATALCYVKRIPVEKAALVGILLFVGIFYRVNYQYLVMYIPLAILCLALAKNWVERSLQILLVLLPASWVWLFDVSFWFRYLTPQILKTPPILERLGLTHYMPDSVFVSISSALMVLCLAYSIVVLSRRGRPIEVQLQARLRHQPAL